MKKTTTSSRRPLSLRRHTVRKLTSNHLRRVAGAYVEEVSVQCLTGTFPPEGAHPGKDLPSDLDLVCSGPLPVEG